MKNTLKKVLDYQVVVDFIEKMPIVRQVFFTVFISLMLAFLFLSLLTYNPADPAWSHMSGGTDVTNIGGRLGAWVADILRVFFGLGVWGLVAVFAYELTRLWWQPRYSHTAWQLRFVAYGFLLACVSAIFAQAGAITDQTYALQIGGVIGFELYAWLSQYMNNMTALVLLVLVVVVATLAFEIRWRALFGVLMRWFDKPTKDNDEATPHIVITKQETPIFAVVPPTTEEESDYEPHNHKDTLESFLVHSGVREEIIATKERQEREKEREKERLAKRQAREKAKAELEKAKQQAQDEPSTLKIIMPEDSTVHTDDVPPMVDMDDVPPQFLHDDVMSFHEAQARFDDVPSKSPVKPDIFTDTPKSRAMSTLEYRMSLTPIPELSLLDPAPPKKSAYTHAELTELSELLEIKLKEFNIQAKVVSALVGPVITLFEVDLAPGIKVSRVTKIAEDLARSMSMTSLRVLPIIAGKPYIGIEVPNRHRQTVSLMELLDTAVYQDPSMGIAIAIGVDISGRPVVADLAKAPHLLVAGMTGSGKSVVVNAFLMSMLLNKSPEELKLILIDPKQVELEPYAEIPHLLTPVITDMTEATAALTWCVTEMERRYALLSKLRVRNIASFNQKIQEAEQAGQPLLDPLWRASDHVGENAPKLKPLPFIVVVADEFADMLMQLGKTAEEPIVRLAQKARAAGIHLILATQRPTANVVTGLIKSNIPSRVALQVKTAIDSRIIIEESGAENMLGHGDMLFLAPSKNSTERVQGPYVKDDEVNRVCDAWRERGKPDYIDLSNSYTFAGEGSGDAGGLGSDDEYYNQAVAFVLETRRVSTSSIQRKLSIGYNRAARIVDMMEENGVVSAMDNGGKRQVLM